MVFLRYDESQDCHELWYLYKLIAEGEVHFYAKQDFYVLDENGNMTYTPAIGFTPVFAATNIAINNFKDVENFSGQFSASGNLDFTTEVDNAQVTNETLQLGTAIVDSYKKFYTASRKNNKRCI